jgi:hypothetical protein
MLSRPLAKASNKALTVWISTYRVFNANRAQPGANIGQNVKNLIEKYSAAGRQLAKSVFIITIQLPYLIPNNTNNENLQTAF